MSFDVQNFNSNKKAVGIYHLIDEYFIDNSIDR